VPHDTRDQVIDFVRRWNERTEIATQRFVRWLGVASSKFYDWRARYGRVNEHNGWVPRDFWLEAWEKRAILDFYDRFPLEGYRRLTFMMLDADVVAVSPASVWRVLHRAGRLAHWNRKPSSQGKGFQQPPGPHQHWHVDISYLNLAGTFYYLCSRDFKEFIRLCGMTHVRTSPFYPQSNGKIERWHQSLKGECLRPGVPLSVEDACRLVGRYVDHYNRVRLHSAIGYVAPVAKLEGREPQIFAERDRKLEAARRQRQLRRQEAFVPLADRAGDSSTAALN
jgi:putative transposase